MDIVDFFKGSLGLTNKVNKVRAGWNPDTGQCFLTSAVNIKHDATGRPYTRGGNVQLFPGAYHSVFGDGGDGLAMSSGSLYLIKEDFIPQLLRSNLTDLRMYYVETNQGTFYGNGINNGLVKNDKSYPWPLEEWSGPVTNKQWITPPAGKHLEIFLGRMLIAVGRFIYYSYPNSFGLFYSQDYLPMRSYVRMIKKVKDGVYVSDSQRVHFLKGDEIDDLEPRVVLNNPAYEGCVLPRLIRGTQLGLDIIDDCAVWGSPEGFIAGAPGGAIFNISEDILSLPNNVGSQGASLFINDNIYNCIY